MIWSRIFGMQLVNRFLNKHLFPVFLFLPDDFRGKSFWFWERIDNLEVVLRKQTRIFPNEHGHTVALNCKTPPMMQRIGSKAPSRHNGFFISNKRG